jgi:uncharacterized protein (UPF0332 family)
VTPEAAGHLEKAREYLTKARALVDVLHYADEAGRAAYLAGYHAAQALIFERTGREAKTHRGAHNQFNRLVSNDPRFDAELRQFLARTYDLKAIADYEFGPGSEIPLYRAESAILAAARLVACVAALLE